MDGSTGKNRRSEAENSLYREIAFMLKLCYPDVIYRFDIGASVWMGVRMKALQRDIQMQYWKHPDLTIYQPAVIGGRSYHGLCLELKAEGEVLLNKAGEFKTEHLQGQDAALKRLEAKGYYATFSIGIHETQYLIDKYMVAAGVKKAQEVRFGTKAHRR